MRTAEQSVGDHSDNERAAFCQFVFCVRNFNFSSLAKCIMRSAFPSDLCHVPPPFSMRRVCELELRDLMGSLTVQYQVNWLKDCSLLLTFFHTISSLNSHRPEGKHQHLGWGETVIFTSFFFWACSKGYWVNPEHGRAVLSEDPDYFVSLCYENAVESRQRIKIKVH